MKIENRDTRTSEFDRLRGIPERAQCSECHSKRNYTNPMARCWECKRKFCFKHIWGGQINDKMGHNEKYEIYAMPVKSRKDIDR